MEDARSSREALAPCGSAGVAGRDDAVLAYAGAVPLARRSHIAARGYLKAWSEDDKVGVGWVKRDGPALLALNSVAVRTGFYLDQDPDGSTNDWFETQMARVESPSIDILRRLGSGWPLDMKARAKLSEFLGLQYVRSPAYRRWHAQALEIAQEEVRSEHSEEELRAAEDFLAQDRQRHLMMAEQLPMVGTFFANMRWTLLRSGSPRVVTSDQPLVPVSVGERLPASAISHGGMTSIAEVRFAVSPFELLLLTWQDDHGPEPIIKLAHDALRNHNTLVIAQADEQWFHHPSARAEYKRQGGEWPSIVSTLPGVAGTPFDTARHRAVKAAALDVLEGAHRGELVVIEWRSGSVQAP